MADFEINGTDKIKAKLQALVDAKEEALTRAGASLLADVQQSFVQSQGPNGEAWAARKPIFRHHVRIDTWKLLWHTGLLFRSMTMNVDENSIEVGTNVSYAIFLNSGTRKMPQREFLFIDDTREENATNAFASALKDALNNVQ